MKTNIFIIVMIVVLAIASHYGFYELGKKNAEIKYIRDTDTLKVEVPIKDSLGYKPQIVKVKEKVNVDSIFQVAKEYWQSIIKPDTVYENYAYVASLDSTYEDDLLKADISLTSRIPIDPEAYYKLKFDVKKELVFVPTYKKEEPSWWYKRFGCFIGGGVGYDINTKEVNPQVGIYFGLNLF